MLSISLYGKTSSNVSCNQLDSNSSLSISKNITSSTPLNWNVSADSCFREGVGCDRNGQVNCIWLPSRNLVGTISTSIKSLSHLKELNFAHNKLSVRLPDGLYLSLNRLEILDFSYNRLSEEFQPFDHFPVSIKMVDLSSNGFSGVLHYSFLLQVWSLISFNVSNNSFYGPLPTVIYNFLYSSITIVNFSFNYFNGPIPNGYGRCSKLKIPCAGFNSITGSLPDDIYQVSTLQELSLPGNGISGQVSEAIGNLSNLKIVLTLWQ